MSFLQELEHLRIPLDDIISVTDNFAHHNFLGQGGFGPVYKGQLLPSASNGEPSTTVAVKRLDVKGGQGEHEFLMEIFMLASYKHENLVSLIGFSDQGHEKILVYKHEDNGSLDNHLASTNLTWEQRLRICLGAARGLEYLHGGVGTGHRVLHRDIKSSNILLDANWEAKISDFGLSKIGPTSQQFTFLVTNACGTFGYVDPVYVHTGVLTKESDVYSIGVVLFEVLCGRLAMIAGYEDERKFLSRLAKVHRAKGNLEEIIMPGLLEQMKPYSLKVFSELAFQCLDEDRKERPTMTLVVQKLQTALEHQIGCRKPVQTKFWGTKKDGDPWSFVLNSNQKLRKITINHDTWVWLIAFTVEDLNDSLHYTHQYGSPSDHRSGKTNKINFDDGEEIIGISGTTTRSLGYNVVNTLCFKTNRKKYGPFGYGGAVGFSKSWDMGLFVGFYGASGPPLRGIGVMLYE